MQVQPLMPEPGVRRFRTRRSYPILEAMQEIGPIVAQCPAFRLCVLLIEGEAIELLMAVHYRGNIAPLAIKRFETPFLDWAHAATEGRQWVKETIMK